MANAVDELLNQAAQARRVNRLSDAMRDLVEAVTRCRKDGDQPRLARSLTALGQIERDKGNGAAAGYNRKVADFEERRYRERIPDDRVHLPCGTCTEIHIGDCACGHEQWMHRSRYQSANDGLRMGTQDRRVGRECLHEFDGLHFLQEGS